MKEDLRIKKTRKLLKDALNDLLKTKNFEDIRLNEICEKAMVHKTTFYHHFTDKYDLLFYVIKELQKELLNDIKEDNSLVAYYCQMAYIYMKHMKENKEFYATLLCQGRNSTFLDLFYDLVCKDFEKKITLKQEYIPSHYISSFYVNAVFSFIIDWFHSGMKESEDQMIIYLKELIGHH